MKRALPLVLGPVLLLAAAVPAAGAAPKARSALEAYRLALADAKEQTSVHWVLEYTGAFHELLTTDDGATSGSQAMLVTSKGKSGFANEMLLPDGTAYVSGTALGLRDGVGLTAASATAAASASYAFTKTTPHDAQVADGLTTSSTVKDIGYSVSSAQPHISFGSATTLGGAGLTFEPVVVIEHIATGVLGTETLYVTQGSHPLPVELKIPSLHEAYTYTWGAKVTTPTAPATSKPGRALRFASPST